MKVMFEGREEPVDLNDDAALLEACQELAKADIKRVPLHETRKTLHEVLTALHIWHIKNGAQIVLANAIGFQGVGMQACLESHNFVGTTLLRKPPLEVESPIVTDDYEPGANDQLEGEDGVDDEVYTEIERRADAEAETARLQLGLEEGDFGGDEL